MLGQPVAYNHLQYGAGALSGVLELPDVAAYRLAMTTAYARLSDLLGDDVDRVVFYLGARRHAQGTLDRHRARPSGAADRSRRREAFA